MAGDVPPPPTPTGAEALKWTLPSGWAQSFPGGMRFATFKVPGTGKIDGSVVTLPGDAGGELANVNRWRGQIGLGPTDDAGLAAARTTVKTRAGPASVYDFTSEGTRKSRLIAAIAHGRRQLLVHQADRRRRAGRRGAPRLPQAAGEPPP